MAGGWRISEAEELTALREARRDARTLRTEEAWNHFARQVARCEHLGLLDDDFEIPTPETLAAEPVPVDDPRAPSGDGSEPTPGPRRYATAD
jgi:hypothetical protein